MNTINELAKRDQWVLWRAEERNGKATKIPYQTNGKPAKSDNPDTWASYTHVSNHLNNHRGNFSGIGFVFSADDPYVGIDLDDCIEDGVMLPWAAAIVSRLDSYTEVSPSGCGVKIWVNATNGVPAKGINLKGSKVPAVLKPSELIGGIEMYASVRYFTFTGQHFAGTPQTIEARDIAWLTDTLVPPQPQPHPTPPKAPPVHTNGVHPNGEHPYIRAAVMGKFADACERLRLAVDGERHTQRVAMGKLVGGLLHYGVIGESEAIDGLYNARIPEGDTRKERKAIEDGIAAGKAEPIYIDIPASPAPARHTTPPPPPQGDAPGGDAPAHAGTTAPEPSVWRYIRQTLACAGFTAVAKDELSSQLIGLRGDERTVIDNETLALLCSYADDCGVKGEKRFLNGLLSLAGQTRLNAITDLFDALPVWDGKDHIAHLASYLHTQNDPTITYPDGTQRTLSHAYLRRWLIGLPAKALFSRQAVMLVLAGEQGIGKTSFVRWLTPDSLFRDTPLDLSNKDSDIALTNKLIWEIGELSGWKGAKEDTLKAFITRTSVNQRLPYGKTAVDMPARCSLAGTTNDSTFLTDDTGNRRYMVVDLKAINWAYQQDVDREQVLAQALHLARQGEYATPQGVECTAQAAHNKRYGVERAINDTIAAYVSYTGVEADKLTTGEIVDYINSHLPGRINERMVRSGEVKRALLAVGGVARRTKTTIVYEGIMLRDKPNYTPLPDTHSGVEGVHPTGVGEGLHTASGSQNVEGVDPKPKKISTEIGDTTTEGVEGNKKLGDRVYTLYTNADAPHCEAINGCTPNGCTPNGCTPELVQSDDDGLWYVGVVQSDDIYMALSPAFDTCEAAGAYWQAHTEGREL